MSIADIPRAGAGKAPAPGAVDTGLSPGGPFGVPRFAVAAPPGAFDAGGRGLPTLKLPLAVPSLGLGGLGGLGGPADASPNVGTLSRALSASLDSAETAAPPSEDEIKNSLTTAFSMVAGMSEETNEVIPSPLPQISEPSF